MEAERWQRIKTIVNEALTLTQPERENYITHICGNDEELRHEIQQLLESIQKSEEEKFLGKLGISSDTISELSSQWQHFSSRNEMIGEKIGPYQITELVGTGGMGSVFKAERSDNQFQQEVAVKMIRKGVESEDNIKRFRIEQEILARLHHPNIARLYDGGITQQGTPYLVMEFIDGIPVDEYCNKHKLTIGERIELFKTICSAVQYAHGNLVVHRDLKTQNIYVTKDGTVKILDFGVAKLLDPAFTDMTLLETQPGQKFWTPQYASPEQVKREAITITTDVYALGVLLHKLLTDTYPLDLRGEPFAEIEHSILHDSPTPPSRSFKKRDLVKIADQRNVSSSELTKSLSGDLDALVLKAIRKEPMYRYNSVGQLLDDIERYQKRLPLLARKGTIRYRLTKFTKRHQTVLTAVFVILMAVGSFSVYHFYKMAEQRNIAQKEAEKAGQISTFLADLFQASTPNESLGESVTARELLDQGAERIDELADQPEIQAAMMVVMGQSYMSLGLFDEAEPLLEKALNMRYTLFGSHHSETAESMHTMGKLMYERGELERSDSLLNEALSIRREMLGSTHPEVADVLMDITRLLWKQRRYDEVEPLAYEVLEIRRQAFPENDPRVAVALQGVAVFLHTEGDLKEAEALYKESLRIYRMHYGDVHLEVAGTLHNLGFIAMGRSHWDEAEHYLRQALDMKLQLQNGVYTEGTVQTLAALGRVHEHRGELAEAEAVYRQGLDIIRDMGHRPTLAGGLHMLGTLLMNQDRMQEAAPMFEESLEIRKEVYGPDHLFTLDTQISLGRARLASGKAEMAGSLLRDALERGGTTLDEEHTLMKQARETLAQMDSF